MDTCTGTIAGKTMDGEDFQKALAKPEGPHIAECAMRALVSATQRNYKTKRNVNSKSENSDKRFSGSVYNIV